MWVDTADLPTSDGHPFFERLNRVLEEAGFDAFVEGLCAAFYAARMGRPSLRPGRYFRLLVIVVVRLRAHAPWATDGELSVGEGMISSESRMRETCMSGSTSGDWKRSHGEE